MKTVYSNRHRRHHPKAELHGGRLVPPFENPTRADHVLARVEARGLGEVLGPDAHGLEPVLAVHDADYVAFLRTFWEEWTAAGNDGDAIASVWPSRRMTHARPPKPISGKMGYYCLAADAVLTEGTWAAASAAADVALTAQAVVAGGERAAFALCRPPGHHAAQDMYGGYCFLNNAAIAAQAFLDAGAQRVAVLDVDFHHGNGTQAIFYDRADVLFLSLHGDPDEAFPYFLGAANERGQGEGEGFNVNYPLPPGCAFGPWAEALEDACARVAAYAPDALVISLGVDTYKDDPISFFRLESADFRTYGGRLAGLGLTTLFVMEGGYAIEEIGINTVNVLEGFEDA